MFQKKNLFLLYDIFVSVLAMPLACFAKYGSFDLFGESVTQSYFLFLYSFFTISMLFTFKVQSRFWKYFSINDVCVLGAVVCLSGISWYLFSYFVFFNFKIPLSFLLLLTMTEGLLLCFGRLCFRYIHYPRASKNTEEKVLVYILGDLDAVDKVLVTLSHPSYKTYYPIGIISNREDDVKKRLRGVPVISCINNIDEFLNEPHEGHIVLMANPNEMTSSFDFLRKFTEKGLATVFMKTIGHLSNMSPDVKGEFDYDLLLRRQNYVLNPIHKLHLVKDQVVLITGAGGSIGSEIVRQVVNASPKEVILIENSEFALYKIDQDIPKNIRKQSLLCDIRDKVALMTIFDRTQPSIVFHAAAIKHVPIAEENASYAFEVNVKGTHNMIDACCYAGVALMVMISTDKAVNPTNIMGATKQIAERLLYAKNAKETKFLTVRFGNVIGSNGSVLPLFNKQIDLGLPITITKEDIVRFFMTISEAVDLVLESAYLRLKHIQQDKGIFVLDMGEQIKVQDMAELMVIMKGKKVEDVTFKYTGLRPGEKMYEELFNSFEIKQLTPYPWLFLGVSEHRETFDDLVTTIDTICHYIQKGQEQQVKLSIQNMTIGFEKTV
jgi:FlaA1/EpsC-like NDP-sugar epimerase